MNGQSAPRLNSGLEQAPAVMGRKKNHISFFYAII